MDEAHGDVHWVEAGQSHTARWRSESGARPPRRVVVADDRMKADDAYHLASEGTALLWRGDFQNARLLLQAMQRRIDRRRSRKPLPPLPQGFHHHRMAQAQRARTLGMLLVPLDGSYDIPLRRAPNVREACLQVYGPETRPSLVSLRELLGLIGAYEWRKKGVDVPALGARIHPHYGVYSPVRGEYVELVAKAPLPDRSLAYDIGTGTGVLAALLAQRGVERVVATDNDPRALACAQENLARLGLDGHVVLQETDLFPEGRAPLVVCNPPWIPARPTAPIERAIYDPDSRMLRGFLDGLAGHLAPGGEGWLVLSDIAEHLRLRAPGELPAMVTAAGLRIVDHIDIKPSHPRVADENDPLHAARQAETTTLWRLAHSARPPQSPAPMARFGS